MKAEQRDIQHCRMWLVVITVIHAIAFYLLTVPRTDAVERRMPGAAPSFARQASVPNLRYPPAPTECRQMQQPA